MKKVLFILKDRQYSPSKVSYGLINSANHIANYLSAEGYKCKVVSVIDSNFIDKEVCEYKPDIVIIEALWVSADKFKELFSMRRYKNIQWMVRIHSDIGYLSAENRGLKLLNDYMQFGNKLTIALNNKEFADALSATMNYKFTYLPNIITPIQPKLDYTVEKNHIDIGCFGALRLLKNQCFQAMCAMIAADELGKKLYFHITPSVEEEHDSILANLKELFKNSRHELVIHKWLPNDKFMDLIGKMDLGMQLSYTESFNIVAADFVNNNKLILVSDAIDWMPNMMKASTTDYKEVTKKLVAMYYKRNSKLLKNITRWALYIYNMEATREWDLYLHKYNRRCYYSAYNN